MFPFGKPSNNKDWELDQNVLSSIIIDGNFISIKNIRNFHYHSEFIYDIDYYNQTFCLDNIETATIGFVPFSKNILISHALMKFDFKDDNHIVFSIEVRKRKGEKFSAWKDIFSYREIMYVMANQQDVIDLRLKHRKKAPVNLYRLNLTTVQLKQMFLDMCARADNLCSQPEFFSTFSNNCTSNLIDHLNKTANYHIPWFYKNIAPGLLYKYLFKNKFITRL